MFRTDHPGAFLDASPYRARAARRHPSFSRRGIGSEAVGFHLPFDVRFRHAPSLSGRVADSLGKPIPVRSSALETDDGRSSDTVTDTRGEFRVEVSGRFLVEIRHSGYRTLRSSTASLLGASADDIYQVTFLASSRRY